MNVATASCTICQLTSCICHQNTAPAGQTTEEGVFQPFFSSVQARANEGSCPEEEERTRSSSKLTRGQSRSRTKEHGRKSRNNGQQVTDRAGRKEKKDRVRETGDKELLQVHDRGRREGLTDSNREKSGNKEDHVRVRRSRNERKDHTTKKRGDKDRDRDRREGRKERQTWMDKRPEHESGDYNNLKIPADPAQKLCDLETQVGSARSSVPQQRNNDPERSPRRSSDEKVRRGERKEKKKKSKKSSRNRREPRSHENIPMAGLGGERNAELQYNIAAKTENHNRIANDPPTESLEDEGHICVSCHQTVRINAAFEYVSHFNGFLCELCSSKESVGRSRVPDKSSCQPQITPPVHSGVMCDGPVCRNVGHDICGPRYRCDTCPMPINLCQECYSSERAHDPTHEYRTWEQPEAVPAFLPPQQIKPPPAAVLGSARTSSQTSIPNRGEPPVIHTGVSCDGPTCLHVGKDISGPRYRCDTCPPSFDLCQQCYQSGKAHDPTHEYRKWEAPGAVPILMPPQQPAQPPLPHKPDPPSSQGVYKEQPSKFSPAKTTSSNSSIRNQQSSSNGNAPRGVSASRRPQEPPTVHSGIICDGSNCRNPGHEILGHRYKCRIVFHPLICVRVATNQKTTIPPMGSGSSRSRP